jgi:hippurate hydrolase
MMAAYDVFDITITGVGGHAAIPQLTRDPIVTAAGIITQLQTLVSRNTNPLEAAVVSVTEVHGGTAYNIIPDQVLLRGTTRHFKPEIQQLIQSRMSEVIQGMATATGVEVELRYTTRYPALVNTETETAMAVQAATAVAGAKEVSSHLQPLMGSEDFAFMLEKVPGAYIGIGSGSPGNATNLHQATYDFNDEILTLGVEYWVTLAERLLSR